MHPISCTCSTNILWTRCQSLLCFWNHGLELLVSHSPNSCPLLFRVELPLFGRFTCLNGFFTPTSFWNIMGIRLVQLKAGLHFFKVQSKKQINTRCDEFLLVFGTIIKRSNTYLVIFRGRPMFNHIKRKLSPRPFEWYGWTLVYLEK